jgi:hypothetical protein
VNPNHGKYLDVVNHPHDGCHWNPRENRGALVSDRHFLETRATFIVGSADPTTGIQYRLCAGCAQLPRWKSRGHRHARIREAS